MELGKEKFLSTGEFAFFLSFAPKPACFMTFSGEITSALLLKLKRKTVYGSVWKFSSMVSLMQSWIRAANISNDLNIVYCTITYFLSISYIFSFFDGNLKYNIMKHFVTSFMELLLQCIAYSYWILSVVYSNHYIHFILSICNRNTIKSKLNYYILQRFKQDLSMKY